MRRHRDKEVYDREVLRDSDEVELILPAPSYRVLGVRLEHCWSVGLDRERYV
jgi:hypothetical protein